MAVALLISSLQRVTGEKEARTSASLPVLLLAGSPNCVFSFVRSFVWQGRAVISASLPFNLQGFFFFLFFSQGDEPVVLFCLLLCLLWVTSQSPSSQNLLLAILALVHPELLISFSFISLCYHPKKKSLTNKASLGDGDHVNFMPRTRDPA